MPDYKIKMAGMVGMKGKLLCDLSDPKAKPYFMFAIIKDKLDTFLLSIGIGHFALYDGADGLLMLDTAREKEEYVIKKFSRENKMKMIKTCKKLIRKAKREGRI